MKDDTDDKECKDSYSTIKNLKRRGNTIGKEHMNMDTLTVEATAKITSKSQITVPLEIRNLLGVKEGDHLRFVLKNGVVYVEPVIHYSLDQLMGIFNQPEDEGQFVLDLEVA